MKRSIAIVFYVFMSLVSQAQLTKVMGTITDSLTGETLPFVSVMAKGGIKGTTTNFDGQFSLELKTKVDSLVISYTGYRTRTIAVKYGKFQTIDIKLSSTIYNLKEFVIVPRENPAEIILKKIIANKEKNNREKFDSYQYELYNKIEFDLNNIKEKFQHRAILKPFDFVFSYMDTSTVNGKSYLPVFLSEAISDYYFQKTPKTEKEIIRATKISGVNNRSVQQFMGNMYVNVNFYDNYIPIFQKNFVSPVANFGLMFYRYYLVDSAFIGNKWCYKVMFKPRRKQELTFTGNFWVNDSTFALKQIDVRMPSDANINFISDMTAYCEYDQVDGENWMPVKEQLLIDFNPLENMTAGLFGKRTASYRNFKLNKPRSADFENLRSNLTVANDASNQDERFWTESRHDTLSKDELLIYHMVDSVKAIPAFRKWYNLTQMLATGYLVKGNFEWGPYASLLSYNSLEGGRVRFGARTSNKFSKKIMIDSYVAYGFTDATFKYGGGFMHVITKSPRQAYGFNYRNDIEQLSKSSNAIRDDFFLTSILHRGPINQLSNIEEYKGYYEKEWQSGFSNKLTLTHRTIFPVMNQKFKIYNQEGITYLNSFNSTEAKLTMRFAYREKFIMGEFLRYSMGSKYPILQLDYIYGPKGVWNSDFESHKLIFNVKNWFNVNPIGWSKFTFEVGKIWGALPYPLLKLHEGNQTYMFDESAFNMMNFYEFVSDKYMSFYYTHHFNGFFLNKIPMLRKLKWRELGLVKGVVGSVSTENRKMMEFPKTLSGMSKPYFEAGVGVENIFKIIRIDALWRLSYLDKENISKFGVRASLQFTF